MSMNITSSLQALHSQAAQYIAPATTATRQDASQSADGVKSSDSLNRGVNPAASSLVPSKDSATSNTASSNTATSSQSQQDKLQQQAIAQMLSQLRARDTEVRAHEMAHLSVAGQYATSGMSFSYQVGPDGKSYAIGGEVEIDVSAVSGDPEATIQKMRVVQAAAMAPAEPSAQDVRVAAAAQQTASAAQAELSKSMRNEASTQEESSDLQPENTAKSSPEDSASSLAINPKSSSDRPVNGMQNPEMLAGYLATIAQQALQDFGLKARAS